MNHPAFKHRSTVKDSAWRSKPYVWGFVILALMTGVLTTNYTPTSHHLLMAGTFLSIGAFGMALRSAEAWQRKRMLDHLGQQMNFVCNASPSLFGASMHLSGIHRNRAAAFYYHPHSRFHAPSTRIELAVDNLSDASFRLRGPFHKGTLVDLITVNMFSAAKMRPVSHDKLFFIGGSPVHLTTNLLSGALQADLETLAYPIHVELKKKKLTLIYPNLVYDIPQITRLSDILSDLADAIEQKSNARNRILAVKQ